mmetsp:Transcript_10225/g.31230  ORF Transcript_10225/g.31230 Transcript_10225/m.31230 type:complete len:114 (+) Transcript_10225:107-448(+)
MKKDGSSGSDPKRPDAKVPWIMYKTDKEEQPPNYYSVMSLVFGMIAITMKVKLHAWLCLLFCIANLATSRFSDMDVKQTLGSVMLAIMTFGTVYLQPQRLQRPAPPSSSEFAG